MWRRLLLVVVLAGSAAGQDVGRVETSLDYSYVRLRVPNSVTPVSLHGVQLGGVRNVNQWLAFGGDFGAYYHCAAGCWGDTSLARNWGFTLLAGPRVRFRPKANWRPFAQASAGLINIQYNDDSTVQPSSSGIGITSLRMSHSGLAITSGGGVDWMRGRAIVRVAQLDWMRYEVGSRAANTVRFSTGFRWQFGMPKRR